jgi:hypothetical protein
MPPTDWTNVVTAIGTVATALAAVGIALWSEWRTSRRIASEREHSNKILAEERAISTARFAGEREHSDAQLREQRAHADTQLREERQLAENREQLAEAYAVQVTAARMSAEVYGSQVMSDPNTPIACPVAIVVNGGRYTITQIEARICLGGKSITGYSKTEPFSSWWNLPKPIASDLSGQERDIFLNTLTPADLGMRYIHDAVAEQFLHGSYPIVRWRDRWGARWEHKRGVVRQVTEGENWEP